MSNEQLAIQYQEGNHEAAGQLWEQNRGILYTLIRPYFPQCEHYHVEPDDLWQCTYFAVVKAAKDYKASKGFLFTAYLNFHIKNAVRACFGILSSKREPSTVSLDAPVSTEEEGLTRLDT